MLVLREITIDAIEEVKKLDYAIFTKEPWNDVWDDMERFNEYVCEMMEGYHHLCFGLFEDHKMIGFSLGRIKHWSKGNEYWIDELGILPEYQGGGRGTFMLNALKKEIEKRDTHYIVLLTERQVQAYHFYIKNGFRPLDEIVFMIGGTK